MSRSPVIAAIPRVHDTYTASDSGYRRHDIISIVTIGYHHTQCRATMVRCTSHLVVGVEPLASSSRSQVTAYTASAATCLAWERPSVDVR
jgi:hypothetical protein